VSLVQMDWVMKINERDFSKELGQRLARLRKEQGLTQQQLADAVGIRQYAVARFEVGLCRVPVALLPEFGRVLGVTVDDLLGTPEAKAKPGPAPKLQKQMEQISSLPKEQQRSIMQVLDMALKTKA
jgi:transcriptional regulator with XRE-family HTH domain